VSFGERLRRTELPRRLLGAIISVLVPGAGHVVLGYPNVGWSVAGAALLIGACLIVSALKVWTGLFLASGALYILGIVASVVSIFALPPGPKLKDGLRALWPVLVLFLVFRGAAHVVRTYLLASLQAPSSSMLPLIADGDLVLTDLDPTRAPVAGDVIVYAEPGHPERMHIDRVIAIGRQRVRIIGGRVVVDELPVPLQPDGEITVRQPAVEGRPAYEQKYERVIEQIGDRRFPTLLDRAITQADPPEVTLGAGQVYVLGDNRTNSHDSRHFGPVSAWDIRAKALFVLAASGKELDGRGRIWQRLWSLAP
jgi:signal peptidase I